MQDDNTTNATSTTTDEAGEDKASRVSAVMHTTGHALHTAGVKVIDTDMRDVGRATKRMLKGLSKEARQARILAKAEAIKAQQAEQA